MSKYHILKNTPDCNNEENDLSAIPTTAMTTPTNTHNKSLIKIDDTDRFYSLNEHPDTNHQHKLFNQPCDDNEKLYYDSRNNRDPLFRDSHDTEDLIDYNNKNNRKGNEIVYSNKKNIYRNNNNNITSFATGKTHNKLVSNTFDSAHAIVLADADITDDTTMEIPLLQSNYGIIHDGNANKVDSSYNEGDGCNNKASKIYCNLIRMFIFT